MNEQLWYLYHNKQQVGPFDSQQLLQLHTSKMIAQDAYVFKIGWKDWRPIEECHEELGFGPSHPVSIDLEALAVRRANAPRASVSGRVVVHNNGQIAIGQGVNISASGLFVETTDQIFTIGSQLKLSVRCHGLARAFNAVAEVIRYNADARYPIGYGLRFEVIDEAIRRDIERLVIAQNLDEHPVAK